MSEMTSRFSLNQPSGENLPPGMSLSLVTICLDPVAMRLLRPMVESIPGLILRAELNEYRTDDFDSLAEWMGDPPPDICLVDFDSDPQKASNATERIRAAVPETAIIAYSARSEPDLIIQAMRSGCSEYLIKPLDREQFLGAVARVGGHKREKKFQYNAQVATYIGAKGGCGVTTLATQLGTILANTYGRKALVVDLHPNSGDAALYLGLTKYRYHSYELVENSGRLDAELLQSFVLHHSSGLDLIPAPEEIEPGRRIAAGAVGQTMDFLRQRYEYILIDLPPGISDLNLAFIRYSDPIYLVTVAEVSALRNAARFIDYINGLDIPQERVRVVVNRHEKRNTIPDGQIEKAIRRKIFWKVPNQYFQVIKTIHGGDPIAQIPRSEVLRSLKGWAELIGATQGAEKKENGEPKKKESRGFMGLFGG